MEQTQQCLLSGGLGVLITFRTVPLAVETVTPTSSAAAANTDTQPLGRCSISADGADVVFTDTRGRAAGLRKTYYQSARD